MPRQSVMDHTGHSVHDFNVKDVVSLAEAEKRFEELTGKGFTAAKRTGPGQSELIRAFDPNAEETVFIPRLQGG